MGPLFPPGSPSQGILQFSAVLAELYAKLNATSQDDAVYWTDDELYQWADETLSRLARTFGVFVRSYCTDSWLVEVGDSEFDLVPAANISVIAAGIAGVALGPANVQETEALDANWPETAGTPANFLTDFLGTGKLRIYPISDSDAGLLCIIHHHRPSAITSLNQLLTAPDPLQEYFSWSMLAEAHRKESEGRKPEVAEHYAKRVSLMEQVIQSYWGDAQ